MKWFSMGDYELKQTSAINGLRGLWDYSYGSITVLFEQISAIPRALNAAITHKTSQQVLGHILRIGLEDLLPLMLVQYSAQALQDQVNTELKQEDGTVKNITLNAAMLLLNSGVAIYSLRKKTQILVRSTIITLETPSAFSDARLSPNIAICKEQACSSMRFVQGTFRDLSAYYATEVAIGLVNFLPYLGQPMAQVLSVYHNGRYIVTMTLPEVCNRHQVEYMHEHAEFALALGIGHATSLWAVTQAIERVTGLPASHYRSMISPLLLASHTLLANQMHLPKAPKLANRHPPDPLSAYQMAVGFTFDTLMIGLKKQIPRLLQQAKFMQLWQNIGSNLKKASATPTAKAVWFLLLPRMLQSQQAFSQDPIIATNWKAFRQTSIETINVLELLQNHFVVKVAVLNPQRAAMISHILFGTPDAIVEILVKLLSSPSFMKALTDFRQKMAYQAAEFSDELIKTSTIVPLRSVVNRLEPQLSPKATVSENEAPETIIVSRMRKSVVVAERLLPATSAENVIRAGMFKPKRQDSASSSLTEDEGWTLASS